MGEAGEGFTIQTSVNLRDWVTILYGENLPPVSIALVLGEVCIRFTGVPGRSYTIERAPRRHRPVEYRRYADCAPQRHHGIH